MTTDEIKKIIEVVNKPKETNVYYDVKEITKSMDSYITAYWDKNKNKYKGHNLIAIVAPKKFLTLDSTVYFLDDGIIFYCSNDYISYDEIIVVGTYAFYHNQKFKDDYVICYGEDKRRDFSKNDKTGIFVCNIIEKFIEEKNRLYDVNDKIKYYLDLHNRVEEKNSEITLSEIILYKKITQMTQDPNLIGGLVEKYGFIEYKNKLSESEGKRRLNTHNSTLAIIEILTIIIAKKNTPFILSQLYERQENILLDCYSYLKLIQDCNQIQGYKSFVNCYYDMFTYAAQIQKKISEELIYKFNLVISELRNKIEDGIIKLPQENNFDILSMIKYISDVYFGEITFYNAISKDKKTFKYTFLKNFDKAYYWLNLYLNQAGSDNTVEYEDIMFHLADVYNYGTGTMPANENKMLECLKTAAGHGCVKATKFIAEYYIKNNSEEKDKWIQLAKENGQKVKDRRSIFEKMTGSVGVEFNGISETLESANRVLNNVTEITNTVKDISGGIVDGYRNSKRESLEQEQILEGQRVENKIAKAKNMKAERKADKAIAREEKKRNNM